MTSGPDALDRARSHFRAGQLDQAAEACREALAAAPNDASALHLLGKTMLEQANHAGAIQQISAAVRSDGRVAQMHRDLAAAYHLRGDRTAAVTSLRQALTVQPDHVASLYDLAVIRDADGMLDEAKHYLDRILEKDPSDTQALLLLGMINYRLMDMRGAETRLLEFLRIQPEEPLVHLHLGRVFTMQGRLDEAISAYETSLALDPTSSDTRYGLGCALLKRGDFARGWPLYESRLETRNVSKRVFPHPRWTGEDLRGRRILVWAEYGLGDTMQFFRFVPLLEALGAEMVLAVQPPLVPLLSNCGTRRVVNVETAELPECDWQVPLLSLPLHFGTTEGTIPIPIPYIDPKPTLVEYWHAKLRAYPGFKVGINWRGALRQNYPREIPLAEFAPLARVPNTTLLRLQMGFQDELTAARDQVRVIDFGAELDGAHGAFMDSAALMKNLDLVITCDTSIAHLAGAIGTPVWVCLSSVSEWRWMENRDDSPWYPTMRLFRQTQAGVWSDVVRCLAGELAKLVAGCKPTTGQA